jgi:hypothetical protein
MIVDLFLNKMWPFSLITSTFVDIANMFLPRGRLDEIKYQVCLEQADPGAFVLLTDRCRHEKFVCLVCAMIYISESIRS